MTAVIAMACADGALIATDSQATDNKIALRGVKAMSVPSAPVVWSGSGSRYALQTIERLLTRRQHEWGPLLADPAPGVLEETLVAAIRTEQKRLRDTVTSASCDLMFAGYGPRGAWMVDIDAAGSSDWHLDHIYWTAGVQETFIVMEPFRPYMQPGLPLAVGQVIAYRALTALGDVTPTMVGGPVQIAVAAADRTEVLDDTALAEVAERVQRWEANSLNYLKAVGE